MQGDTLVIDTPDGYRYRLKPFTGEAGVETALTMLRVLVSMIDGKPSGISKESTPMEMVVGLLGSATFDKVAQHLTVGNARPIIEHLAACTEIQTPEMIAAGNAARIGLTNWSEHFRGRFGAMRTWLVDGLRWQTSDFFASWLADGQDSKPATQSPPESGGPKS
jgi:hypothetical protein